MRVTHTSTALDVLSTEKRDYYEMMVDENLILTASKRALKVKGQTSFYIKIYINGVVCNTLHITFVCSE